MNLLSTTTTYPRESGSISIRLRVLGLCGITLIALAGTARAQTAPDAGQLLREQSRPAVVAPAQPAPLSLPTTAEPVDAADAGPTVLVEGFRISGALLIPEAELAAQLQSAVGSELSLRQLQGTAAILTVYYVQKGYLARVILPPQDIKDGIVNIQVIEGKRGSLRIDSFGERLNVARVQRMIEARLAAGGAMDLDALGESLNILNEQPGVEVKSALVPGKGEAEIDLVVSAADKPLTNFVLGLNSYGSAGTGEAQATGKLTLNNPTGAFDAATLLITASEGSTFTWADYNRAIGDTGLRLGINASALRYHITQDDFSALDAEGTADTLALAASYPLARRNDLSLSLTASYDDKQLVDRTIAGESSDRHVSVGTFGLSGYQVGGLLGSGITSFGASLSFGDSEQRNATALATDRASREVQGSYSKLSYNLGHQQALAADWSFNTSLRGQFADKNLGSIERMSLGGPSGIRAYPVGEASGDDAWLLSLNLGYQYNDKLAATLFLDAGGVTLNRDTWTDWNAGNPSLPNRYELAGLGIGMDWRFSPKLLLSASIAAPAGSNPGRDANDHNIDGSSRKSPRGWLNLTAQF